MQADRHGHSGGQGQEGDSSERTGEGHGPLRKGSELKNSMRKCLWGKQVTAGTLPIGRPGAHLGAVGWSS